MHASTLSVALSALSVVVVAQISNFTIDPNEVTLATRASWCTAENNNCQQLCGSVPKAVSCDPTTLKFNCICGNGTAPGLEYYTNTLPTFICNQAFADCIGAHANDQQGQATCQTDIEAHCGRLDPAKITTGGSSGSSSSAPSNLEPNASATLTAVISSTAGPGTGSSSNSTGMAPANAAYIGHGIAAFAVAIFAVML